MSLVSSVLDNYKYPFTYAVDDKSPANSLTQLTAKCTQENITTEDKAIKMEFFNPFDSNYTDSSSSFQELVEAEGKYSFVKYNKYVADPSSPEYVENIATKLGGL